MSLLRTELLLLLLLLLRRDMSWCEGGGGFVAFQGIAGYVGLWDEDLAMPLEGRRSLRAL